MKFFNKKFFLIFALVGFVGVSFAPVVWGMDIIDKMADDFFSSDEDEISSDEGSSSGEEETFTSKQVKNFVSRTYGFRNFIKKVKLQCKVRRKKMGNDCWFNASTQCLIALKLIMDILLTKKTSNFKTKDPKKRSLLFQFLELNRKVNGNKAKTKPEEDVEIYAWNQGVEQARLNLRWAAHQSKLGAEKGYGEQFDPYNYISTLLTCFEEEDEMKKILGFSLQDITSCKKCLQEFEVLEGVSDNPIGIDSFEAIKTVKDYKNIYEKFPPAFTILDMQDEECKY